MSFLARLSLANRGLVALITIAVVAFGVYITPGLQQQLLPSMSLPQVSVVASYAGAAPQIVEDQVTVPLEEVIRGVADITTVTSTSREASASIQVAFDYGVDIDDAQSKIQQAVSQLSGQLPDGVEPQVVVGSTDDLPVIQLAAASEDSQQRLADQLKDEVVPVLSGIEGVKEASVTGTRDQVITITPDADELKKKGLDASAITSAIQNAGQPIPAGTLTRSDKTLNVQVGGRFDSINDLKDLYLAPATQESTAQGTPAQNQRPGATQAARSAAKPKPVRLGDVATVKLGLADSTTLTRTDGKPSLGVSVTMKPDGNAVSISEDVRAELPTLAAAVGSRATLTIVYDQAPEVEKSIDSLTTEGLLGLAMAVLIILLFLFSVRSTLVTAISIPLSVIIALIAIWAWDYSLNMLTLGALTIAIGRVVDDSIVVLENIKRHLSYGESKRQAIETGVREVAGAVTASTLTTVAVFLPMAFVGGLVGQLFGPFSVTVTVALLASLVVSLTVVPALSYWFLKPSEDADRHEAETLERSGLLQRIYVPIIRFAVRYRLVTLAGAVAILIGTFTLIPGLKTSFIDNAGQNTINITQTLPAGTSLTSADKKAKQVEKVLADHSEIDSYQVTVGGGSSAGLSAGGPFGGGGGGGTARASYSLTLHEDSDTAAVQSALRDELGRLSDVGEISIGESGGFGGDGLEVQVHATEQDTLRDAARIVQDEMSKISGVTEVTSTLADTAPRIDVSVDRKEAAERGLSEVAIGQAVAQVFRGSTVTQLAFDDTTADVIVSTGDAPVSLNELRKLDLPGGTELADVADVKQVDGPVSVTRIDGQATVSISGTNTGADLGTVSADLDTRLAKLNLPEGATYSVGGASANQSEAFGSLGIALVAAIALVFFVMVATFHSLIQPLVLLVSIPFAATGAIGLLRITDTSLGLAAMIGLLMLVGIVVTNAIVLLDLINQYRRQGMPLHEAVVEGGRNRLRPILMTALATIFALLPMALGITGGGGFISKPLAIVVIGGLISSTLLTLVLVPTLYTMVESRNEKSRPGHVKRHAVPPRAEIPLESASVTQGHQ